MTNKHLYPICGPPSENKTQSNDKDGNGMAAEITAEYNVSLAMSKVVVVSRQEEASTDVPFGAQMLKEGALTRPIQNDENLCPELEYATPPWTPRENIKASNSEGGNKPEYSPKRKFQREASIGHGGEDEPQRKKQGSKTDINRGPQMRTDSESYVHISRCLLDNENDFNFVIDPEDPGRRFSMSSLFGRSPSPPPQSELSEPQPLSDCGREPNDEPPVGSESSQSKYMPSLVSAGSEISSEDHMSEEVVEIRNAVKKLERRLENMEKAVSMQKCLITFQEVSGSHNIVGNGNIVGSQNRTEALDILGIQPTMGHQYLPHRIRAHYDLQHGVPQVSVQYAQPQMGMESEAEGFAKSFSPQYRNKQPPTPIPQHYYTQRNSSSQPSSHQDPLSENASRSLALRSQQTARPREDREEDDMCCRVWQFKTVKKTMDK